MSTPIETAVTVAKILGSETRVKILLVLIDAHDNEICVKNIAETIGLSHSATSHQLAKLNDHGIVRPSREGQTMCYCLTDSPLATTIVDILHQLNNTHNRV